MLLLMWIGNWVRLHPDRMGCYIKTNLFKCYS
jgi:hypothetical protein